MVIPLWTRLPEQNRILSGTVIFTPGFMLFEWKADSTELTQTIKISLYADLLFRQISKYMTLQPKSIWIILKKFVF